MEIEEAFEHYHQRTLSEGRVQMLQQLCERRLGRSLTPAERKAIGAKAHALGTEGLGAAVLELDATALTAWLAEPSAR